MLTRTLTAATLGVLAVATALTASSAAAPDGDPTCIRGPWLQNNRAGSNPIIRWELDRPGLSMLRLTPEGGKPRRLVSEFLGRMHRVSLEGLTPGARYRYQIFSGAKPVTGEIRFRAAPGASSSFQMAVFGDCGKGNLDQRRVAKILGGSESELVLLTGDVIYGSGELEHYDLRFFAPYAETLPRMNFWPSLGNHDVKTSGGAPLLAMFDVPGNGPRTVQRGRNYAFDYGDAHIVAIDTNTPYDILKSRVLPWLEKNLDASDRRWKLVFAHHPVFSSAKHGGDPRLKKELKPILERAGVAIYFAGHDHTYERTEPIEGVVYVVSGNGGARLYEKTSENDWSARFYNEKHGLTLVTIEGDRLTLVHRNVDGEEIDRAVMGNPVRVPGPPDGEEGEEGEEAPKPDRPKRSPY